MKKADTSTEICILPEPYNTQMDALAVGTGLTKEQVSDMKRLLQKDIAQASEWETEANSIVVVDAKDTKAMKSAGTLRKKIKKVRTAIQNKADEGRARASAEVKLWNGVKNLIKGILDPIEDLLQEKETFADRAKAAAERALHAEREAELSALGYPTVGLALSTMSEEDYQLHLDKAISSINSGEPAPQEIAVEGETGADPDYQQAISDNDFAGRMAALKSPQTLPWTPPETSAMRALEIIAETLRQLPFPKTDNKAVNEKIAGLIQDLFPFVDRVLAIVQELRVEALQANPAPAIPTGGPDPFAPDFVHDKPKVKPEPPPEPEPTKASPLDDLATTSQILTLQKLADEKETDLAGIVSELYNIEIAELTRRQAMAVEVELRNLHDQVYLADADAAEGTMYAQTPRENPVTGWSDTATGASVGPDTPDEFPDDERPEEIEQIDEPIDAEEILVDCYYCGRTMGEDAGEYNGRPHCGVCDPEGDTEDDPEGEQFVILGGQPREGFELGYTERETGNVVVHPERMAEVVVVQTDEPEDDPETPEVILAPEPDEDDSDEDDGDDSEPVEDDDDDDDDEFDLSKPWTLPPGHPNYVDYEGVDPKELPEDHPLYSPF